MSGIGHTVARASGVAVGALLAVLATALVFGTLKIKTR
jgi:hypothetical protein